MSDNKGHGIEVEFHYDCALNFGIEFMRDVHEARNRKGS
jgi:hypothetical protein